MRQILYLRRTGGQMGLASVSLWVPFVILLSLLSCTLKIDQTHIFPRLRVAVPCNNWKPFKVWLSINIGKQAGAGLCQAQAQFSIFSKYFSQIQFRIKLSKPKFNQQLNWTEFEIRLYSQSTVQPLCTMTPDFVFYLTIQFWFSCRRI
jgi:hypothetical protein